MQLYPHFSKHISQFPIGTSARKDSLSIATSSDHTFCSEMTDASIDRQRSVMRVSDIYLTKAGHFGFDQARDEASKSTISEAENIMTEEVPLEKKALRRAKQAIHALADAKSAARNGKLCKNVFTHFHQNRLGVFMSCAIEDSIPGRWTYVWSNTRVNSICISLHSLLDPILKTSSKLLCSIPISVVAAFLQCMHDDPTCLTAEWWEIRNNRVILFEMGMNYILNLFGNEKLSENQRASIRQALNLLRPAFAHLSAYGTDLSQSTFLQLPQRLHRQMCNMGDEPDNPGSKNFNPLYFTEKELLQILKVTGFLDPAFKTELKYTFALQKLSLNHSNGEAVGSFCYMNSKKREEDGETVESNLFTLDAFVLDATEMIIDLVAISGRQRQDPWQSELQNILFELGQTKEGNSYVMNLARVLAIVEVFGGLGFELKHFDYDDLAREIAAKLNMKGNFTKKRFRIVVEDPRFRKRAPNMLKKAKTN